MKSVPSSERVHITLFGLRNAGKSSLLNAIAGRSLAIVSPEPGTTTDPVSRPMELGELGPVVLTDTAGLDDEGSLGALRVERSRERLSWTDLALLVTPLDRPPHPAEREALELLRARGATVFVAASFADRESHPAKEAWLEALGSTGAAGAEASGAARGASGAMAAGPPSAPLFAHRVSATKGEGVAELRAALAKARAPGGARFGEDGPLEGLVESGDLVLLVTPIDSSAPKGRLILPQAEVLRDALDRGCAVMTARETELAAALAALARPPKLVVTDSQAFGIVAGILPPGQALTSFSILFARKKGELAAFAPGLRRLGELARGAASAADPRGPAGPGPGPGGPADAVSPNAPIRLLAVEACTHNRTHEDIATVKIPKLLAARTGRRVELRVARELSDARVEEGFDLAVLCGGCMATRARMKAQLAALEEAGVPALNFGLFLAWAHGAFPRAVEPFGEEARGLMD